MTQAEYDKLSTAIIQRFMRVFGSADALRYARRVPNLNVAADGTVRSVVTKQDLSLLAQQYKAVGGSISLHFMRNAIAPFVTADTTGLPDELR